MHCDHELPAMQHSLCRVAVDRVGIHFLVTMQEKVLQAQDFVFSSLRKYTDVLAEIASAAPRKNLRKTVDVR